MTQQPIPAPLDPEAARAFYAHVLRIHENQSEDSSGGCLDCGDYWCETYRAAWRYMRKQAGL